MCTLTGLVDGAAVPTADGLVRKELARLNPNTGGRSKSVGIRNETGDIYRWIRTIGLQHYADVISIMAGLGYLDDVPEPDRRRRFDAVLFRDLSRFRCSLEHDWNGRRSDQISSASSTPCDTIRPARIQRRQVALSHTANRTLS